MRTPYELFLYIMPGRLKSILVTSLIIGIPITFLFIMKCGRMVYQTLPYLGPVQGISAQGDTLYHTIQNFEFTDQLGRKVTRENLDGSIYVASYFFATCTNECPRMNANLERVYERYKDVKKVKFISFTVDPEHDSPSVLLTYSKQFRSDPDKWYFVTGNKDSLYALAEKSFLIQAGEGDAKPVSFIHSSSLILVDSRHHIRGIYDGLDPMKMDEVIDAIQLLLTAEKRKH